MDGTSDASLSSHPGPFGSLRSASASEPTHNIIGTSHPLVRTHTPDPQLTTPTLIHFGQRNVRARIDRNVSIDEIIRQLCSAPQLLVREPANSLALRDASNDDLITPDNLNRKLDDGVVLKLVPSPAIEAAETITRLRSANNGEVKQAVFSLRTLVKEDAFGTEFNRLDGATALSFVILKSTGNTLAYALSALQSLLDLDYGFAAINIELVAKVVNIVSTQQLVNIVRPALHILRKLILAQSETAHMCGFNSVWPVMAKEDSFFRALAIRLTRDSDKLLMSGALALLNTIIRNLTKEYFFTAMVKLEQFNYRKAVINLIENRAEDITPYILQFQQSCANYWHSQQLLRVDFSDIRQLHLLQTIYQASGLQDRSLSPQRISDDALSSTNPDGTPDYLRLGFSNADYRETQGDFEQVGVFGLTTLYVIATTRTEDFSKMVLEQVDRPDSRRCPIATVSLQVSRILSEQFDFSGSLASASFQPFLLDYYRIHFIVMEFFVRIFSASGATVADFERISTLTMCQVQDTLGRGAFEYQSAMSGGREPKTFFSVKQEFDDVTYEDVRDRQMKEMEVEDDLLAKLPVRSLRDRLYREHAEFMKFQRIHCMQVGSWFTVRGLSSTVGGASSQRHRVTSSVRYRFLRLAANRRYIHWVEASERPTIGAGLEGLPEKIELSGITHIVSGLNDRGSSGHKRSVSGTGSPLASSSSIHSPAGSSYTNGTRGTHAKTAIGNANSSSSTTLSLAFFSHDALVANLVAPTSEVLAEWVDGLNILLGGVIASQTSANVIQKLTDIGVKLRLLDLTGERLDIPSSLPVPPIPLPNVPFFYAE